MPNDNVLNEVIGRLRINESKLMNLRDRLLVTDSNMIAEYKNVAQEIKNINSDLKELKNEILNLRDTIQDITKNMQNFASSQDFKVLEKYINLWNPLNFVTEKEVKKLMRENA